MTISKIHLDNSTKLSIEGNEYYSQQSANVLFNFMSKLEYLKSILTNRAIIPRYYEETVDYLEIDEIKRITFPMSCFCDIHLNKLIYHMDFYGYFGIGLNKNWGVSKGIQPILYINNNSPLIHDFQFVLEKSLEESDETSKYTENYNNYLLTNLLYMKPLHGKMLRNGEYISKNFHDEREWRYVPNLNLVKTELPLLVPQEQMNPKAYQTYSEGIKQVTALWLTFDYENIKYLIVKSDEDRVELIDFISNSLDIIKKTKLLLISKILVFNELKVDW